METLDNIKKAAEEIRDASQPGENTAAKVGGVLVGLAEHIGNGGGGSVAPTKKKKLKWRKVARRSIRLGATVEKGNPVKYWGTNHQIVLNTGVRYKLYINDEVLKEMWKKSSNIQYSIALKKNATLLRRFDDGSFIVDDKNEKNICVPVGYENEVLKKSFMYVDKVVTDGDITEVYLIREIPKDLDTVEFDNGNKYYSVTKGYVVPKNVYISKMYYMQPNKYAQDVCEYGKTFGRYEFKVYIEVLRNLRSNNKYNGYYKRTFARFKGSAMKRSGRVIVVPILKGLQLPHIELQRRHKGGDMHYNFIL